MSLTCRAFAVLAALALLPCCTRTRKEQLREVVDKNTGHAHFTRGMASGTVSALDREVGPDELPLLVELTDDSDSVVAMTAYEVLFRRGEPARQFLLKMLDEAKRHGDLTTQQKVETVLERWRVE